MMNEHGKSDGPIVPAKPPNNGGGTRLDLGRPKLSPAEEAEGRGPAKGNRRESRTLRTQCRNNGRTRASRRYVGRDVMFVLSCPSTRQYPRQEPDAVIPPVRICAGGGPKGPSLPRLVSLAIWPLIVQPKTVAGHQPAAGADAVGHPVTGCYDDVVGQGDDAQDG